MLAVVGRVDWVTVALVAVLLLAAEARPLTQQEQADRDWIRINRMIEEAP